MCRLFTQCVAYLPGVSLSRFGECVTVGMPWRKSVVELRGTVDSMIASKVPRTVRLNFIAFKFYLICQDASAGVRRSVENEVN